MARIFFIKTPSLCLEQTFHAKLLWRRYCWLEPWFNYSSSRRIFGEQVRQMMMPMGVFPFLS